MRLRSSLPRRGTPQSAAMFAHTSKVWYQRQTGVSDRLSEPELRRLAQMSDMREYPPGELILGASSDADLIYLVKAGRVKVSKFSPNGKEQILALLQRGDLFGALAPAEPPAPTRVEAFDCALVCSLQRTLFEDIIRNTPDLALRVIRALAHRLRAAEREIEDLALRDVPGRLASVLLRLAKEYGEQDAKGIRISFRLTHHDLAHIIGSTRETVTTIMNRFRDAGFVAVEQRILVILDGERLGAIAHPRRV